MYSSRKLKLKFMKQNSTEQSLKNSQEKLDKLGSALDVLAIVSLAKDLSFLCKTAADQNKTLPEIVKAAATAAQISRHVPGNLELFCKKNGLEPSREFFQNISKIIEPISDAGKLVACVAKVYLIVAKGEISYEGGITILACSRDFFNTSNKILAKNNLPTFSDALNQANETVKNVAGAIIDFVSIAKAATAFDEMSKAVKDLKTPKSASEVFNAAAGIGKVEISRREVQSQIKPVSASALKDGGDKIISSRL